MRLEELPQGGEGLSVEVAGRQVALFLVEDRVHAVQDTCPHRGASLGMGVVVDGDVACPWHSFHFCLRTGRNTDGLDERIRVWSARVADDGTVEIAFLAPAEGSSA